MDEVSYSGEKKPIHKRFSKRSVIIVVIILIIIVLLGGVAYFVTRKVPQTEAPKTIEIPDEISSDLKEEEAIKEEITKAPEEDTKEASLERSEITVSVQNGSGEAGVAGEAADILRNLGYDVASTGNADNFEYEDVTVQVKASSEKALTLIEKDLEENYTIGKTSTDLSEDEAFDALVIIGT